MEESITIGVIGQGYVGKSYADDFESRGFTVIRYALEEPYVSNRDRIHEADVVFVAVPTPTRDGMFDDSIVRSALTLVRPGAVVVIKSTMVPGTTDALQASFPELYIMHSPEFLSEKTAIEDVRSPRRHIIGIPHDDETFRLKAEQVLALLPPAPYATICSAREAEILKYANNAFFYSKVVFMNVLYDLALQHGASWENIRDAMAHEPWIGTMHIDPVHKTGRGAGGSCFVKDFAAFRAHYEAVHPRDEEGIALLRAIEEKNRALLSQTGKDEEIVKLVYGE